MSLVEVRVLPPDDREPSKTLCLSSIEFWNALDDSGTAGHWCCCVTGTIQLFTKSSSTVPAASIVIHDGEGMKLKAGNRVIEFESGMLRDVVGRRLESIVRG